TRLTDDLRKTRAAAAADVAVVAERLRQRAQADRAAAGGAAGSTPAGAGSGLDGSALACLHDAARTDLVALAALAQLDADHLAACQQYVREVVPLCQPQGEAGD
ncbi:MAG: lysis protein, partial [Burkholderiales bacterium]|nr:lysis protein [Burkholderiales bacterium]